MNESESSTDAGEPSAELGTRVLMDRVAAVMVEIERVKHERSIEDVRAARTRLAALHGAASLRRRTEQDATPT